MTIINWSDYFCKVKEKINLVNKFDIKFYPDHITINVDETDYHFPIEWKNRIINEIDNTWVKEEITITGLKNERVLVMIFNSFEHICTTVNHYYFKFMTADQRKTFRSILEAKDENYIILNNVVMSI